MGLVELSLVKPGMVLEKSVYSHSGVILLKDGRSLGEKDLLLLEAWGVTEVDIQGIAGVQEKEQVLSEILNEEELSALDVKLDKKFSNQQENEIIIELKKVIRKIKIEEIVENKKQENG